MHLFDRRARRLGPAAALALLFACHTAAPAPQRTGADTRALHRDVAYLSSDALEGRGTGTPGNDSAAAYIARRYAALDLQPTGSAACTGTRCPSPYFQPFSARSVAAAHAGVAGPLATQNVVAVLRGADPKLRDEYVVLGAHFDHLGRSALGSLDPDSARAIRNGADDNASGTAAILELARLLAQRPPKRSIIFVTFSGEELGLLGSQYFVDHPPLPLERVAAMLNFDMVGRMRDDKLIVYGVGTARELPALLDSANAAARLDIRPVSDGFGPSDHSSFYGKGIPVLHFFTDLHEDYHRATDDAAKINFEGMARVVNVAARVTRAIADRPARLTPIRAPAPAPIASSGTGFSTYLGTIPDMGAVDVRGVRLTGVRPGSPADKAGLMAGDVIVEFAGRPVNDLYEYSDALRTHKPGDVVQIVAERKGERITLSATLGSRND